MNVLSAFDNRLCELVETSLISNLVILKVSTADFEGLSSYLLANSSVI